MKKMIKRKEEVELLEGAIGIPKGADPTDKKYCIHIEYKKDYANDEEAEAPDGLEEAAEKYRRNSCNAACA